jgi:hypothetical protein
MHIALLAPGLAGLPRLLAAAAPFLIARIIVRSVATRILRIIFFGVVWIGILRLECAVGGGHDHQLTLPYLANLA